MFQNMPDDYAEEANVSRRTNHLP